MPSISKTNSKPEIYLKAQLSEVTITPLLCGRVVVDKNDSCSF